MSVVVIGLPGQDDLWIADLAAGTVARLPGPAVGGLLSAQLLAKSGGTVVNGVNLAVAVDTAAEAISGKFTTVTMPG